MNLLSRSARQLAGGALLLSLLSACGGGKPVGPLGTTEGELAGHVIKGPVAGGTVTAYRATSTLERGAILGSAVTDEAGAFSIKLGAYNGPLVIVASSGVYTEEALGTPVQLSGQELVTVLPAYRSNSKVTDIRVTPLSSLASAAAAYMVRQQKEAVEPAVREAFHHLTFGGDIDWQRVRPADFTTPGVTTLATPEARAGLVLAALSHQAKAISEQSGLTPGTVVTSATLATALVRDMSDGILDGNSPTGPLRLGAVALDGQTLRGALATAVGGFISSERNKSALRLADVKDFMTALADPADTFYFCHRGEMCGGGGAVDIEAPRVSWVSPVAGTGVAGQVAVEVRAQDSQSGLKSFRFTEPSVLSTLTATFSSDKRTAVLAGTWNVSALADGPAKLVVIAEDSGGNTVRQEIEVSVANKGPTVAVSSPAQHSTVAGTVSVVLSAEALQGRIAKLELLNGAALGVGADTAAEAESFRAAWDTRTAPEGLARLHFRAEDTLGTATAFVLEVKVDNVALGVVTAAVSAGAPVAGATVKLFAVDEATGAPVVGRPEGALLGQGVTGTNGRVTFTLNEDSGENWVGPVQLVASGAALSYVDPSGSGTEISLDSTTQLTSYLPSYRSGQVLSGVPVTLWTTLADAAALAYSQGKHRNEATVRPLSAALAVVDPLFSKHLTPPGSVAAWSIRDTLPLSLTTPGGSPTLRAVVLAALPDVALNRLARDTSVLAGFSPGETITAESLMQLLREDLLGDGQFDGLGAGGAPLKTPTAPTPTAKAYELAADSTRADLALAFDRFVQSPANVLGLTRSSLQGSGVYDTMSLDTSLLYPSAAVPRPFDNTAPSVSFSATYADSFGSYAPRSGFVRGTLTLKVTATDATAVDSLEVALGSTVLTAVPSSPPIAVGGSTSLVKTYVVNTTAQPDGELRFTASVRDSLGNADVSTFVLKADNTPPVITRAAGQPTPGGFYGRSVPVEATAADTAGGSGLASFTHSGFAGLVDGDGIMSRIHGTWTASSSGPATLSLLAVDLVGNAATLDTPITVDLIPPTLAFVTPPPEFMKPGPLFFSVSAADNAGGAGVPVDGVEVRIIGSDTPYVGTPAGSGVWTFTLTLAEGRYSFALSAKDAVGNKLSTFPTFVVSIDGTLPEVKLRGVQGMGDNLSRSEEAMTFVEATAGVPQMPVVYAHPTSAVAQRDGHIVKALTRLSYGSPAPSAAELLSPEYQATQNVPFLAVNITENGSGLASVTYSVRCESTATCGALPPSAGVLIHDPSSAGTQRYLLPLSLETVPGLNTITGPASLLIEIFATDGAGNRGDNKVTPSIRVVGPPLGVREDTSYASAGDPKSAYAYKLANNTYAGLYDASNPAFGPDGAVRLVRVLVNNPAPQPVALSAVVNAAGDAFRAVEAWHDDTFRNGTYLYFGDPWCGAVDGDRAPSCSAVDNWLSCMSFTPATQANPEAEVARSSLVPLAYLNPSPGGRETVAATRAVNGAFVVPAAVGTTPGQLVLYVNRPRVSRTGSWAYGLAWSNLHPGRVPSGYQHNPGGWFRPFRTDDCEGPEGDGTMRPRDVWAGHSWIRYLHRASTQVSSDLVLTSHGLAGSPTVTGGEGRALTTLPVSRTLAH